jgi:hypothetical protein
MAGILGLIAAGVSIAGTLYGALSASSASDKAASASRQAASDAQDLAKYEADLFRARGAKLVSSQRALYGVAGVQMIGSPLEVIANTSAELEQDALAIQKGGQARARQLLGQAEVQSSMASSLLTAGLVRAGGQAVSLLTQEGLLPQ